MRFFFCLSILLIFFSCNAQKELRPNEAVVIFTQKNIVEDREKAEKSMKNFYKGFSNALQKDLLYKSPSDSLNENLELEMLKEMVFKDTISTIRYLDLHDNRVKIYAKLDDGEKQNSLTVYDLKNKLIFNEYSENRTSDSIDLKDESIYERVNVIAYEEFPQDKKKLNGFDCFKVKIIYKEFDYYNEDEQELQINKMLGEFITYREMYVTKGIKFMYHPVVNQKEILEKYYPLEITDYSNIIEGEKVEFRIKELWLR